MSRRRIAGHGKTGARPPEDRSARVDTPALDARPRRPHDTACPSRRISSAAPRQQHRQERGRRRIQRVVGITGRGQVRDHQLPTQILGLDPHAGEPTCATRDDILRQHRDTQALRDQVQQGIEIADLERHAALQAGRRETAIDTAARALAGHEIDEGLARELIQRHRGGAGQRMAAIAGEHHPIAGDDARNQPLVALVDRQDREIELPILHPGVEHVRGVLHQPHLDLRMRAIETRQQGRQGQERRQTLHDADRQRAAPRRTHPGDPGDGAIENPERAPRALEKGHARLGQADMARGAHQQPGTQFLLEQPDRGRQGRLDDMASLGRAREVRLLGDGNKMS